MASLFPFSALRFADRAGRPEELVCPPYDIIGEEQRQGFLKRNPHNIIRLELPRDGADPYAAAGAALREWLDAGVMKTDETPALYLYEIRFSVEGMPGAAGVAGPKDGLSITGLIARVGLEPFEKGVVLPHEETLSKAKTDRFNLMKATACNFSSIYSLYMDDDNQQSVIDVLKAVRGQPLTAITDADGLTHTLWAVTDADVIAAVTARFRDKKLYIADGHHRYETALNYRNWRREQGLPEGAADSVMMTLVEMSDPGLVVFPTHRLIHSLPAFDRMALLDACGEYFDIAPAADLHAAQAELEAAYAAGRHAFALYDGAYTMLTLKDEGIMDALLPGLSRASRLLDVTILHSLVLERLLGIDKANMAGQVNLRYTRDPDEAIASVDGGESQCAVLLNPTRVTEIRDVAAASEKMPQKSTYFYPKLITGLAMNRLDG